jgi:hypothetical protein
LRERRRAGITQLKTIDRDLERRLAIEVD